MTFKHPLSKFESGLFITNKRVHHKLKPSTIYLLLAVKSERIEWDYVVTTVTMLEIDSLKKITVVMSEGYSGVESEFLLYFTPFTEFYIQ
jgi:hypothetical protein